MRYTNLNNKFDMGTENNEGWLTVWSAQGVLQHLSQNPFIKYKGEAKIAYNSTNFNSYNGHGILYLGDLTNFTNSPGTTFNYSYLILINSVTIQQIVIKPYAGKIAMREYSGSPSSWSTWKIITGS